MVKFFATSLNFLGLIKFSNPFILDDPIKFLPNFCAFGTMYDVRIICIIIKTI